MTLRSLAFSMLCLLTLIRAEDGIPFPGPTISATTTNVTERELTIGNNTLTATFVSEGSQLRLATLRSPLNGLEVAWSDPNLFTIHRTSGDAPLTSSAMKLVAGPEVRAFVGIPGAARLADRLSGCQLQAAFRDESSGLFVQWRAVMTDGSNTLRQEVRLSVSKRPLEIDRIEMIRTTLPGAQVAGYTDGSPITTDKLFLGIEHPMARNLTETGGGSSPAEMRAKRFDVPVTGATIVKAVAAVCDLPRQCALEPGAEWSVSSGIGVYPAGQLRRAFLYYLERERAHPYRQYWHYNSWYDLNIGRNDSPDPLVRMTEAQCLDVIAAFGRELHEKRGVGLNGFVWDDGWDDWNSLWKFHPGFPNGFTKLKQEATTQGADMGAWLSPWGGYGASHASRVKLGREHGYETNAGGFSLGGPKYYAAFRDVCLKMIHDYNQNYFKFDGIGSGMYATGAPPSIAPDLDGLVRLLAELRQANPAVFVNCTVGTWASPYWTWFADSVWRQGEDCAYAGEGNARERWITYRDERIHARFARPSPLYPLNSMMYHGLLVGDRATPASMPTPAAAPDSCRHEILMSVGCGSGLGELYVTHKLMTPAAWDLLAEGIRWSRRRAAILGDTHWVGGSPLKEVYGYAAWHPQHGGTLVLRNPTSREQQFTLAPQPLFELPAGAPQTYRFSPALGTSGAPVTAAAGNPATLTLKPFEVLIFDAAPPA